MTTKQLFQDYIRLRDELAADGPSDRLYAAHMDLFDRLYHLLQRRNYEEARIKYAIYREFLDSPSPMTEEDIANFDASMAVSQEITELLRARTRRKRGRGATHVVKQDAA